MYFLKFNQETNLEKILELRHTHVGKECMKLEKWKETTSYDSIPKEIVQIWFKLRNIPPHMYNAEALSHFASLLGNPLYMDKITKENENLTYARMSVEVQPISVLPNEITVVDRKGNATKMGTHYEWRPYRCVNCNTFKHSIMRYPKLMANQKANQEQQMQNGEVKQQKVPSTNETVVEKQAAKESNAKGKDVQNSGEGTKENQTQEEGSKKGNEIDETENSEKYKPKCKEEKDTENENKYTIEEKQTKVVDPQTRKTEAEKSSDKNLEILKKNTFYYVSTSSYRGRLNNKSRHTSSSASIQSPFMKNARRLGCTRRQYGQKADIETT
ncbi:uncharacterized protein LOC124934663 [Impatiens glandulifera]|uniref:uncharacterized protein LOC124934663 n=1 Tax=Impatiens glandulifera TaxID=253017 RepID=UPI001FB12C1D|nr:uncharacterized protein LOC124934663 [Impatiens glandulifera]